MLLKMALVIIALIILLIIMCFISDHIIDKQFKKEQVERDIVENRLTESLKILCVQLGIDLSYHKELDDAAGRILYYSKNGRLFVDEAKIEILEKYEHEPYVLAHELGHYMAIKQRQDNSERGADNEANKLCRLILNKKEQEILSISLRCYFQETEEDK